jgi:predicted dehydrogenase
MCAKSAKNCDLLAVCDTNAEKAKAAAEQYGCDAYTGFTEMLKRDDIDIVSICTPSGMHCEMAVEAANAGKHCMMEKPIDVQLAPIDRAIGVFAGKGLKLGCIFQNRLEPVIQMAREAVSAGRLGTPLVGNITIKWHRTDEYYLANGGWRGTWKWDGGGSLINQSIHTIDILQWLMGEVDSVFAVARVAAHAIETEDIACALVKFKNGAMGTITGSTATYPGFGTTIEVHGTRGGICIRDMRVVQWKIHNDDKQVMDAEENSMIEKTSSALKSNVSRDPNAIGNDTTFLQIQDFIDSVREKREPMISGKEGREAVKIILAIYESARTGREVKV